ncbi:uncharacterized protein PADG_03066 [Paracoccidioides brasiliensis Pb18]|uniref:Uncharacterized protein n=1 Tax=Paracoccidioides brasiliensis (strain Pb18) TaxID=502780 RepID=C1G7B1_PARBD|nr:uncharacterized protein PADG_03066 [Paracoccidioides brasiliensis Pb18]EEH46968.2 hypothetical protein PADG_03066 [Paracoccidioides brasiliensis Pb18]
MSRLPCRLTLHRCPGIQAPKGYLYSKLCIRLNSSVRGGDSRTSLKGSVKPSRQILREPVRTAPSKSSKHEGIKLEKVLIYHAGSGKIAFIGVMRITTILIFSVSCLVVAPAFYYSEDLPWYIVPAIVVGGSIPMLFVLYTTAPFVNFIYLSIPRAAQRTRQRAQSYLKDVPRNAVLNIETMKFNFYFRKTQVVLSDLILGRSMFRPVNLINTNPMPQPWWKGNNVFFYAPAKTRFSAKPTSKYFPEVWEEVFAKIKKNAVKGQH